MDELGGDLRDDRVAVAPQKPHAAGYPCSQRECSGFNWPGDRLASGGVSAEDPVGWVPESASCTCIARDVNETPMLTPRSAARSAHFVLRAMNVSGVPPASCAAGVAHAASGATVDSWLSIPPVLWSRATGVGQNVSVASLFSPMPRFPSASRAPLALLVIGVDHAAIFAAPVNLRHG